jgi:5-methylthioadenosine/S-adenosylhomocysteine deaminase
MMVTCLPGDVLARAWGRQIGRIQPGAQADLLVINAKRGASAFPTIIQATEDAVDLVVINGQRRYGIPELMSGASTMTTLTVAERTMQLSLSQPSSPTEAWQWSESDRPDGGGASPPEARGGGRQCDVCALGRPT